LCLSRFSVKNWKDAAGKHADISGGGNRLNQLYIGISANYYFWHSYFNTLLQLPEIRLPGWCHLCGTVKGWFQVELLETFIV